MVHCRSYSGNWPSFSRLAASLACFCTCTSMVAITGTSQSLEVRVTSVSGVCLVHDGCPRVRHFWFRSTKASGCVLCSVPSVEGSLVSLPPIRTVCCSCNSHFRGCCVSASMVCPPRCGVPALLVQGAVCCFLRCGVCPCAASRNCFPKAIGGSSSPTCSSVSQLLQSPVSFHGL